MSYVHPFAIPLSVTGEPLFRGYRGYVRRLTGRVSCSDTRRCVGMIFNLGYPLEFREADAVCRPLLLSSMAPRNGSCGFVGPL